MTHDPNHIPGDILVFGGHWWDSRAIAYTTCSFGQWWRGEMISHVGICAFFGSEVLLFESKTDATTPCVIQQKLVVGAQAHHPRDVINDYYGKVWRLRLTPREMLDPVESKRLTGYLCESLGTPYDRLGAAFAGSHWTKKWLSNNGWLNVDLSAAFCDEWVLAALMDIKKVERFNGSIVTPAWLAWYLVNIGLYQPLELIKDGK